VLTAADLSAERTTFSDTDDGGPRLEVVPRRQLHEHGRRSSDDVLVP
jgi:hypothetical protein